MLRISYSNTGAEQRWKLCGQLAGAWVDELRSCWQFALKTAPRVSSVMDLSDVTFVDEAGERLLADMRTAGAEFVAAGVETMHLLDNLKANGEKPLRRIIGGCK
jgi:anti-anti-sigma regulatory factor